MEGWRYKEWSKVRLENQLNLKMYQKMDRQIQASQVSDAGPLTESEKQDIRQQLALLMEREKELEGSFRWFSFQFSF